MKMEINMDIKMNIYNAISQATLVAIKKVNKSNINITKPLLMDFKRVSNKQLMYVFSE